MSLADKLASKLNKLSHGTSRLIVRDSYRYAASIMIGFIALTVSLCLVSDTYATSSSITVTMDDNIVDLNVAPTANGTFSKSSANKIGVATTNYTGYTLSISASGDSNNGSSNNDPTALVNGDKSLLSIENALTEDQFKALDSTAYNNMWGYLPSKYCSGNSNTSLTCAANDSFLPSPTTDGDTLDVTSTANTIVNEYEITLGARVDSTASLGSYSNVFLVEAVANKIPYTITYLDNTISNMPVDISDSTTDTTVTISSNTPTRHGYTFVGWCTVTPTNNANGTDTCPNPGTQVSAGGTLTLEQTSSNNNFTLYAMWSGNYTIEGIHYLQDFAGMSEIGKAKIMASMVPNEQHQLVDKRDNKTYWISLLEDGHIWMTQALDLDLNTNTTLTHATSDIGWSENNPSKTWTPQSTANTISFEGGTGTTMSGWQNSNDEPYSASPYYGSSGNDVYILSSGEQNVADTVTNLSGCTNTGKSEAECQHYKVGNYYNFAAATATNSVSTTVERVDYAISDADDYTIMPNSICPAGWRLPKGITGVVKNRISRDSNSELDSLFYIYNITSVNGVLKGQNAGFFSAAKAVEIRSEPLYFTRSGYILKGDLSCKGGCGDLWSSTISSASGGYDLDFTSKTILLADSDDRWFGFPVRCLVR